jgi:hypothetical protein
LLQFTFMRQLVELSQRICVIKRERANRSLQNRMSEFRSLLDKIENKSGRRGPKTSVRVALEQNKLAKSN